MTRPEGATNGHHSNGTDKEHKKELEHDEKVKELREALGPLTGRAAIFCTDDCLRRYLRARNWNVHNAEKMLRDTLAWRNEYRPEEITWEDIAVEAETGKVYRTNYFDRLGRPVITMVVGKQNTSDQVNQIRHLVYCLENAIMTLKDGQEKMAWLIDYRGWSLRKSPPLRQSLEVLNILQNHYPERLGAALSYDPPHIFQAFWKLIRPFIDPVTANKILFLYSSSADTLKQLDELIGLEQLEHGFGGQAQWEFAVSEYAAMMREDDRRIREHWGVAEKGEKDVGWLPSKPQAVHGWGHAFRQGHGHNAPHGHADKHGEPGSPASTAASNPASPHKKPLGFDLKRPTWLAGKQ